MLGPWPLNHSLVSVGARGPNEAKPRVVNVGGAFMHPKSCRQQHMHAVPALRIVDICLVSFTKGYTHLHDM